jgi:mannose-6-phosphate isomerase-like protein (cupin superfamily)
MPVTSVTSSGKTYALFVTDKPKVDAAKFFTQHSDEFQVGVFERPTGYEVKPHMHPAAKQTVRHTTEFLYFEEGGAQVTIFDEDWNELHRQSVKAGDFLVFFRGGHSLVMEQETRLVEVKQGPYPGDSSAKVFKQ